VTVPLAVVAEAPLAQRALRVLTTLSMFGLVLRGYP